MRKFLFVLVVVLFTLPQGVSAMEHNPSSVVAEFHRAVKAGDRDGVVKLLLPELIVFEDSYMEPYEPYISGHLVDDMNFSSKMKVKIIDQREVIMGESALVLTQSELSGEFMGRDMHIRSVETMVLRKGPEGWKIAHIHSSNRELK